MTSESRTDYLMGIRQAKACGALKDNPRLNRAVITDTTSDPRYAVVSVAVRGIGVGDLLIPKAKYDPFLFLSMLEQASQLDSRTR